MAPFTAKPLGATNGMSGSGAAHDRRPPLRMYLLVGGDEAERGLVAGNVARAAGATYMTVNLEEPAVGGHRCRAMASLGTTLLQANRQSAPVGQRDHPIILIDRADSFFDASPAGEKCAACADSAGGALLDSLRGTGGTFLLGVETPPRPGAWGDWRPDVVVYLRRVETSETVRASLSKAMQGRSHIRVGSGMPGARTG